MSGCALRCNNIQCRLELSHAKSACITKCSHIFCTECASGIAFPSSACPACRTALDMPADMTTVALSVTEKQKSFILAGLHPSVVADICGRALSFWSYQTALELAFYRESAGAQQHKAREVEAHASAAIAAANARATGARAMAEDMLEDRSRQLQSLKAAYDGLCQQRMFSEGDV
ncbi:hypothetical protein H4R18_003539 [Coemansia javaensis]|uniref:RING-type domain-containing protein n=1 Tax=Coemansia javaensis TaxID=2761396 RepID=A0A9W8LI98_9FUNG|nr:hypothetical protein H4R18_003539 [Coemansia javaensis]